MKANLSPEGPQRSDYPPRPHGDEMFANAIAARAVMMQHSAAEDAKRQTAVTHRAYGA
jgi:hypothetical protein